MKKWLSILSMVLPLGLQGCFEERSAGTSTETENAFGARLVRVDSVFPLSDAYPGEAVVATLRLDESWLDFSKSRPDGQDLEIVRMDGRVIPFELDFWDTKSSVGRLHVRLDPSIRYFGSHFWLRWGLPPARRDSPVEVWEGIPYMRRLAWNSVLVDDFESGSTLHNLLPDSAFWFLGGSITGSGISAAGSSRTGSSLHVTCLPGQCDTGRVTIAATMLSRSMRSLRGMDSVELWARGAGSLWVAFESLDSVQMGRMARGRIDSILPRRAWASRPLGATWQRLVIRPDQFQPADGAAGNVGWNGIRDSLNYLTLMIEGGSELWIDDIRFHGVVKQDLQ